MFGRKPENMVETERMTLRLPRMGDYDEWAGLRRASLDFLAPWEPVWAHDHLSRTAFSHRVSWAKRAWGHRGGQGAALSLLMVRRTDARLLGGITLDHIRRGPVQAGVLGYWIGQPFARQGYMREAILALVHYGFTGLDLSRIEAACLPENTASRGVLEKTGFKYEGVAQSYLQIAGRWRNHVLYANLRSDRRGKTDAGVE